MRSPAGWTPIRQANRALLIMLFGLAMPGLAVEPHKESPSLSAPNTRDKATSIAVDVPPPQESGSIRIATFNVSLAGEYEGQLRERLESGDDPQMQAIAEIVQLVNPDIVLLNEFDFEPTGQTLDLFVSKYLEVPQTCCPGATPVAQSVSYPHRFIAPVNTGVASKADLDRDGINNAETGSSEYARDAWGFGRYPGQYGMALLSRLPIEREAVRTFQHFLWKDMPGALLPEDPGQPGKGWYNAAVLERFPLSSKSHWDVPVRVGNETLHVLCCHPTPPVFDGPEDRNGRRNHDEIRFWADYIDEAQGSYIVDDRGRKGGLGDARFVILGDLNSDPQDGTDLRFPIRQLLDHARIASEFVPVSRGAPEQAAAQGGANSEQQGEPAADTGDFGDKNGPGNLRLDYVLPSAVLRVVRGGVFWPASKEKRFALVGDGFPVVSSDHRLVWVDVQLPRVDSTPTASQE